MISTAGRSGVRQRTNSHSVHLIRGSGEVVHCERRDTDRYGRVVAICRARGEDLNAWMVGLGWALAYREYSTHYVPAENLARVRRAGVWAGEFNPPWEWRRDR